MHRFCVFHKVIRPTFLACVAIFAILFSTINSSTTYATTYSTSRVNYTKKMYVDDFTADYYLYRDENGLSRMIVVEQITAIFPNVSTEHGLTRIIPFTNNDGKNLTMKSDNTLYMNVERNGNDEPVDHIEIGDGYFIAYIGDANKTVSGEQEYTLVYEYENVILDHEADGKKFQELYWDSNGTDSQQSFNSVTARVHLDNAITDKFTGATDCYVGKYGENGSERCEIKVYHETLDLEDGRKSDTVVEFASKDRLAAKENLTFVLQFDEGTFAPAKITYRYLLIVIAGGVILAVIATIVLIILAFKTTAAKRKYYKGLFVKPEYTPMPDITVAEMAQNYIGKGVNGNAKVATLIDLAVHHKIEMIKTEESGAFGKKKTIWKIRVKTDTMNKQQATVLKILAGSNTPLRNGQEITIKTHTATSELTGLTNKFATLVTDSLVRKGLAEDTKKKSKDSKKRPDYCTWLGVVLCAWVIAGIGLTIFLVDYKPSYGALIGGDPLRATIIVTAFVMAAISIIAAIQTTRYNNMTTKGLDCSKYLEGLKLYMGMAEAERLKLLQSVKGADTTHEGVVKIYEKLLPYAVIFKMEKSWLDELSHYYEFDDVAAPAWYIGIGAFSARDFSSAMMSASNTVSSTIVSSSVSNSSSGFSGGGGGGFSGGGGGGGGVGSW